MLEGDEFKKIHNTSCCNKMYESKLVLNKHTGAHELVPSSLLPCFFKASNFKRGLKQ